MLLLKSVSIAFAISACPGEGVRVTESDLEQQPSGNTCMNIVGHRGSSFEAPENTMASVELALSQGAQGVEFDIQKSKDGKIFLLHDDTLERTAAATCPQQLCGEGGTLSQDMYAKMLKEDISQLSYAEFIRHVDVGSRKNVKYAAERPPLLENVMKQVPDDRFVLCEVKGGDTSTADAVVDMVKNQTWTSDRLRFIGFDLNVMVRIKTLLNEGGLDDFKVIYVQQANTPEEALSDTATAAHSHLDGVDFEANPAVVTSQVVQEARNQHLHIGVWVWKKLPFSDTKSNAEALEKLGIDFFTSDLPLDVQTTIEKCKSF